jgi:hypothetical protein
MNSVHNVHIPLEHQAAPTLKYDPVLAREAAEFQDKKAARRRDWDSFDREMDMPGHHDPGIAMLRRAEKNVTAWTEENLELWELNCQRAAWQQWQGQERWQGRENEEMRLVNILYPEQVMRKLRKAGVDARSYEHPNADIWLNDWTCNGLVGLNVWVPPTEMDEAGYLEALSQTTGQKQKDELFENYMACVNRRKIRRTVTSLQSPGPEFSIMRFNAHNVPTKEKFRGWRTAMLVLIYTGILTEEQVNIAFGPAIGEAGAFYRQQLYNLRQLKVGKAI